MAAKLLCYVMVASLAREGHDLVDVRAILGSHTHLVAHLDEKRHFDHRAVLERRVLDAQRRVRYTLGRGFLNGKLKHTTARIRILRR